MASDFEQHDRDIPAFFPKQDAKIGGRVDGTDPGKFSCKGVVAKLRGVRIFPKQGQRPKDRLFLRFQKLRVCFEESFCFDDFHTAYSMFRRWAMNASIFG